MEAIVFLVMFYGFGLIIKRIEKTKKRIRRLEAKLGLRESQKK